MRWLLPLLLVAAPAFALDFKIGPSLPLVEVRPGVSHPVLLAPGAGIQGGLDLGKLNVDLAVFGSLLNLGNTTAGAASSALFACYAPVGACAGVGVDLAAPTGGLITGGWSAKNGLFLVFAINYDALSGLHFQTAPVPAQPTVLQ